MMIEKDRDILRTIIEVYVGEGVPVSSQRVRQAGRFPMSTATIRNRMVVLEREGYIAKAHVSSGRIPTDEGYRVHVDELQADRAWTGTDGIPRVRDELRVESHDVGSVMLHASQLLGELSKHVAVVYGSIVQENRVRAVKLFAMDGGRILVVVHLSPEHECTTTLRIGRDIAREVVADAERVVNRLVAEYTLEGAKQVLAETPRDNVTDEGVILREIAVRREEVFSEPPAVELWFETRGQLLAQPELSDPRILQRLLQILHDRDYLISILAGRPLDRTEVTIGGEHGDDSLRPFSLVTAGYRMGAARGVLGVIGPTRMRYDVALSLVASISRELRALGDEFF